MVRITGTLLLATLDLRRPLLRRVGGGQAHGGAE